MSLAVLSEIAPNGSPTAVDFVRISYEAASSHWFRWVLVWGFVVAIGCMMEVPETLGTIVRWYKGRFKHEKSKEDESWRVPLAALGLLLVIAGVAGETICESLVSKAETSLRDHESQILSDAESKSGLAQSSAADAQKQAAELSRDTERLKFEAESAKRDMVKAQLEQARLTSPIQSVPVIDGVAAPEPTKGLRLRVLLHTDVRIKLPTLPLGKALTWTLFIVQDDKGNHQFSTFPHNVMFGNFLNAPPHSFCSMELVTDENGTTDTTFGGASCPTNQSDPVKK